MKKTTRKGKARKPAGRQRPRKKSAPAPALAHSREESLARLLDGVKDCAIYLLDINGCVASWNPGAERIKGYTEAEIVGRHFSEFYTPEDRAEIPLLSKPFTRSQLYEKVLQALGVG